MKTLADPQTPNEVKARAVEAASKIDAANAKDPKAKELGTAILKVLDEELKKQTTPSTDVIRLGLTAALRARPAGADETVRKFFAFTDPNIVADALNTLTRLRAKNANRDARDLLATSVDAMVRAGAARVLGAAEDKDALDVLLKAATTDQDSRVRVSAIRALGSLKDAKGADQLIERGERLLTDYKRSKFPNPVEKNELLEISSALGKILPNSSNEKAIRILNEFDKASGYKTAEIRVALAQISPKALFDNYDQFNRDYKLTRFPIDWHIASALAQGFGELAKLPANEANKNFRERAAAETSISLAAYYRINGLTINDLKKPDVREFITSQHGAIFNSDGTINKDVYLAAPDVLRAYAAFKPEGVDDILLNHLKLNDVQIRATAAELLADRPISKANVDALNKAFDHAFVIDEQYDDAQLAILDALFKLDKKAMTGALFVALTSPDYLVRKKALKMYDDDELKKSFPGIETFVEVARKKHRDEVLPYQPRSATKLGQVLNTDADYRRALLRKNGTVKAVLTTEKGTFTIDFNPEEAPLTVDNFIKLARSGYFNGLEVHRVVPNFVMQDGDPHGDGNGGPGWSIRCEINMLPYDRGAVGMALSGKDTGGSQWFVTHSPQPHLDGGYTVFGHVNETGMKVVDNIVRGDKIISVRIVEGILPQKGAKSAKWAS